MPYYYDNFVAKLAVQKIINEIILKGYYKEFEL